MKCCRLGIVQSPCFPIVLLNFMVCCSMVGLIKTMGVLFGDISKSIQMNSVDLGTTLGLFYAGGLVMTPIAAALFSRNAHPRLLLVIATTIGNGGTVLASLATSKILLFIAFAISGTGHNIVLLTCSTALGRYAGENFNVLYSLSTCGNSVGMVLLPFLAEELLDVYGWRGVLLILSGLLSNAMPCAMAIRIAPEGLAGTDDKELQGSVQMDNVPNLVVPEGVSDVGFDIFHATTDNVDNDRVKDIDRAPLLTLSKEHSGTTDDSDPSFGQHINELAHKNRLDYIIDIPGEISLWFRSTNFYTDPISTFIFLSNAVLYFVYTGWHSFLIPHALQRGISQHNTIIIVFVAAIGNLSIRLVIAFLTHRLVDPISMHLVFTIFNILSLACDAFIPNFYVMLVTSWCSAAAIPGRAVLAPLAIRDRVSDKNFAMAMSVDTVLVDCGIFLGGYISGLIAASFSSYDATFKLLAAVDVLTFIFMLLPKLSKKPN